MADSFPIWFFHFTLPVSASSRYVPPLLRMK